VPILIFNVLDYLDIIFFYKEMKNKKTKNKKVKNQETRRDKWMRKRGDELVLYFEIESMLAFLGKLNMRSEAHMWVREKVYECEYEYEEFKDLLQHVKVLLIEKYGEEDLE
jgi:hypothetical protein